MLAVRRRRHLSAIAAESSGAISVAPPLMDAANASRSEKLERSFRAVQDAAGAVYERFFERLFAAYPNAREALPPAARPETRELLEAVALILAHRQDPQAVRSPLHALGRRHATQGLRPPHYRLICEVLVRSIADLCGAEWDAELECEWTSSLNLGAAAMIEGATTGGVPHA